MTDSSLEEMGAVPERAAVGHRPRGLQRGRRRLGLLQPRPGPLPGLPLGRGRPGRHLRRPAAALLRPGPVEREGPDPQGAAVRPDQQRGQPRRGRQGVLLLPRQHADALVHEVPLQVPAGGVPLRRPRRDQPQPRPPASSSTSCSTPASSTSDRYFDVFVEYAKASPGGLLVQITVHNRGPEAAELHVLPTLWFRNEWSWQARPTGRRCGRSAAAPGRGVVKATHHGLGERYLYCDGDAPLLFTENETNTSASSASPIAPPTSRTASTTTSSTARRGGQPGEEGDQGRGPLPRDRGARRVPVIRLRPVRRRPGGARPANGARAARSARLRRRAGRPPARRPTSSTDGHPRRRSTPTRPTSCGRRWRE